MRCTALLDNRADRGIVRRRWHLRCHLRRNRLWLLNLCHEARLDDPVAADVFALQDAGNRIGAVFRNPCLCLAFYADDAVVLPPNDTTATSKESISKAVGDLLTLPSLTIDWQPAKIEVARSGDIAYAPGRV